jgi:cysteine synthase
METPIIKNHYGVHVVRDDLLEGGTKSVLMKHMDKPEIKEFVYASPVYGGFQIAISAYCKKVGKKATIFCAKRNIKHPNTVKCLEYGANVIEVEYGYMSVIEKKAREYCLNKEGVHKIIFGAKTEENKKILGQRIKYALDYVNPDEIWVAIGSGLLVSAMMDNILPHMRVYGVQVGADPDLEFHDNLTVIKYPKSFDKVSKLKIEFSSMPNYDLKAFELCLKHKGTGKILFWNVL